MRTAAIVFCFFLKQHFPAQTDLAGRVDVDHLHEELFAFLQLVAHVLHAVVRDLGDVEQAVGARHDLDERAEIGDALHLAHVGLVELGRGRQLLDDRNRLLRGGAVSRRDVHAAIVLHVDLHAGPLDDAADHLAARSDDVADLVHRNPDGDDARRKGRDVLAGGAERFLHLVEDVQPAAARLIERLAHDFGRDAADLDVHLQRRDAFGRAGDLEVHVAVVVFGAGNVGEDGVLAALLVHHEPHRDAGDRLLDRHAGVHHRERSAAHGRHRRGAVRLEDVRHDADGVGELLFSGHHRRQRAFRQSAVANFAAARTRHATGFADRERREVVVEHEALPRLALEALDLLRIVGGAERAGDERLRFAAREDGRAVRAREDAGLDPDVADLVELAAVEPDAVGEHFFAEDLLLQLLEDRLRVGLLLGFGFLRQLRDQALEREVHRLVVFELLADAHRLGERPEDLAFDLLVEVGGDFLARHDQLLLTRFLREIVNHRHDLLDGRVRRVEGGDDLLLGDFLRARFDHHQPVLAADDDEVELALFALLEGRVDDELAVDEAHADGGDRLLERDVRESERHGRPGDREHVGVVLLIGRQDERDDLRLEAPAFREQRPRRAVDAAAREHFLFGRPAFALEEAARDASRGVGVFAVIDGQREEVDTFAGVGRVAGRDEDHRIAEANDDRAVRLLGELAGFKPEGVLSDGEFTRMHS